MSEELNNGVLAQLLRGAQRSTSQMAAGLAENFLASPEYAKEVGPLGYAVPGAVHHLTGLANLIHRQFSDDPVAPNAPKYSDDVVTLANEVTGATDPQNAMDVALRYGPSAALPAGKVTPLTSMAKAFNATKPVEVAARVGDLGPQLLVPFNQSGTRLETALGTALPVGLHEGADAIVNRDEYTNINEYFKQAGPQEAQAATVEQPVQPVQEEQTAQRGQTLKLEGLFDTTNDTNPSLQQSTSTGLFADLLTEPTKPFEVPEVPRESTDDDEIYSSRIAEWVADNKYKVGFGAALLGIAAGVGGVRAMRSTLQDLDDNAEIAARTPTKLTQSADKLKDLSNRVSDAYADGFAGPVSRFAAENRKANSFGGADEVEDVIRREALTVNSQQSLASRLTQFAKHGRHDIFGKVSVPVQELLDRHNKMTPAQRQQYDELLALRDIRESMVNSNATVWRERTLDDIDKTIGDITDTDVLAAANRTNKFFQDMLELQHRAGEIDIETFARLRATQRYYVPRQIDDMLLDEVGSGASANRRLGNSVYSMSRGDLDSAVDLDKRVPTIDLLIGYMNDTLVSAEEMRFRRLLFNNIDQSAYKEIRPTLARTTRGTAKDADGNPVNTRETRLKDNPAIRANDVVRVRYDGKDRFYKLEDASIAEVLNVAPTQLHKVFRLANNLRKLKQMGTTGKYVSTFIPTSWLYEGLASIVTRRSDMQHGPVGELLSQFGASERVRDNWRKFNNVTSLDAIANVVTAPFTGTARGIYGDILEHRKLKFEQALREGPGNKVFDKYGEAVTRQMAERMAHAYHNSTLSIMRDLGASSTGTMNRDALDPSIATSVDIDPAFAARRNAERFFSRKDEYAGVAERSIAGLRAVHGAYRANRIARVYGSVIEHAYNAYRISHMAANIQRKGGKVASSHTDRLRAASRARELTGDPGVEGSSTLVRAANATIAYHNVFAQSIASIGRAIKHHPTRFFATTSALTLGGVSLMLDQIASNEAIRDQYTNKMTPEQRSRGPTLFGENGEVLFQVPLPHEFRFLWSAVMESALALSGLRDNKGLVPREYTEGWLQAFDADVPDYAPRRPEDDADRDLLRGLGAALMQIQPFSGMVGVDTALAASGFTLGSRHNPASLNPVPKEGLTGEEMARLPASSIPAEVEAIVETLIGAAATPLFEAIYAAERTTDEGLPAKDVASAMLQASTEQSERRLSKMFGQTLFPDSQQAFQIMDGNARYVQGAMDRIRRLDKIMSASRAGARGTLRPAQGAGLLEGYVPPNLVGTQAAAVWEMASHVRSRLRNYSGLIDHHYERIESLKADANLLTTRSERNDRIREHAEEIRKAYHSVGLELVGVEKRLRQQYGLSDFRLDDMNIDELKSTPIRP